MSATTPTNRSPEHRRRRASTIGRLGLGLGATALLATACNSGREASLEELIEQGSGGDVDIDFGDDGFSIETEDGEFSIDMDEDGSFTFDSDEGSGSFDADGEGGGDFSFEGDDGSGDVSIETDEDGNVTITDDDGNVVTGGGDLSSSGGDVDLGDLDLGDLDIDLDDILGDLDGIDLGDLGDLDGIDLGDLDLGDLGIDLGDVLGGGTGGGGTFTVEGADGETAVVGDEGFTVTDESGSTTFQTSSEVPEQWPGDIPTPPGLTDVTGSFVSGGGMVNLSVIGSTSESADDYLDAYSSVLEDAGFEQTSSFDSAEFGGGFTAERGSTVITVNVSILGEDSQVIVGLQVDA